VLELKAAVMRFNQAAQHVFRTARIQTNDYVKDLHGMVARASRNLIMVLDRLAFRLVVKRLLQG
jgi:hypothetical protein